MDRRNINYNLRSLNAQSQQSRTRGMQNAREALRRYVERSAQSSNARSTRIGRLQNAAANRVAAARQLADENQNPVRRSQRLLNRSLETQRRTRGATNAQRIRQARRGEHHNVQTREAQNNRRTRMRRNSDNANVRLDSNSNHSDTENERATSEPRMPAIISARRLELPRELRHDVDARDRQAIQRVTRQLHLTEDSIISRNLRIISEDGHSHNMRINFPSGQTLPLPTSNEAEASRARYEVFHFRRHPNDPIGAQFQQRPSVLDENQPASNSLGVSQNRRNDPLFEPHSINLIRELSGAPGYGPEVFSTVYGAIIQYGSALYQDLARRLASVERDMAQTEVEQEDGDQEIINAVVTPVRGAANTSERAQQTSSIQVSRGATGRRMVTFAEEPIDIPNEGASTSAAAAAAAAIAAAAVATSDDETFEIPPIQPSRSAVGRLRRELSQCAALPPTELYSASLKDDNLFVWKGKIKGPSDTPYFNGTFNLEITFPYNYPFSPPKMLFLTKIYHCNIGVNGHICLNILQKDWSPALNISRVLLSIVSLLSDPNPYDPMNAVAASEYLANRQNHDAIALEWTREYAMNPDEDDNENGNGNGVAANESANS